MFLWNIPSISMPLILFCIQQTYKKSSSGLSVMGLVIRDIFIDGVVMDSGVNVHRASCKVLFRFDSHNAISFHYNELALLFIFEFDKLVINLFGGSKLMVQVLPSDNCHYVNNVVVNFIIDTVWTTNTASVTLLQIFDRFE